ncbi:MAG: manganese transporter permease [Bdellovibrionota bacterium]
MLKGLKAIILERFHPAQYLPMIFVFTLSNGLYLNFRENTSMNYVSLSFCFLIMLSAFFRLRLFDEIKDYKTDLKINPQRPLARNAISISQTKQIIAILILFEIFLSSTMGLFPFFVHLAAITYSLLMFEEFFIGDRIRPHLTTYAITHTLVSVLYGISAAVLATKFNLSELNKFDYFFFLMNWAYFNLFEFARKTYARQEERPGVDTYSSLFGPVGAGFLCLSQVFLGLALIIGVVSQAHFTILAGFGLFYCLFCLYYMIHPTLKSAKLFRNISGAYLLTHYTILVWIFWR